MPNITSVIKEEIVRLARKEIRAETERLKKASAQYRSEIAALKRQVAALEKQLGRTEKKGPSSEVAKTNEGSATSAKFNVKALISLRKRLGLTAAEMGVLVGISAQSFYLWERGKTTPRQKQIPAIAALKGIGRREAKARLASLQA